MWYRYRRGPRGIHSLWFLFIPLFFFAGHSFFGLLILIGIIIAISLIGRVLLASLFGASTWGPTPNQYYQQQPYQNPYQQQPYQSYQQGYQPRAETYQEGGQQQYPQQQQYDQYEQPQAQYPQEMPPMQ